MADEQAIGPCIQSRGTRVVWYEQIVSVTYMAKCTQGPQTSS